MSLMGRTGRRGFLQKTAFAGSWLAARAFGANPSAGTSVVRESAGSTDPVVGRRPVPVIKAPIAVVTASVSADANPRGRTWTYVIEILRRTGLFFDQMTPDRMGELPLKQPPVAILAGQLPLTAEQRGILAAWVTNGGAVIGIGGTSGLDDVFGISGACPLAEGWIRVDETSHPITSEFQSSLHVFGGCVATAASARKLAEIDGNGRSAKGGGAIFENRFGAGGAILLAPDLIFSIAHIQQGSSIMQDGRPAPDGNASVNDGTLKAEDGLVLDWARDRQPMSPDDKSAFLEPVSDELREIILRAIFHACQRRNVAIPMLWYWPRLLRAVGLISHDSDHNDPAKASALLDVMNRCRTKSTWSILYPGGYPKEFYAELNDQGHEIGLHYDALTGGPNTSWARDCLRYQHDWLLKEAGVQDITSNKNHYTRWEGRLDFMRWCEQLGIRSDQTRGPSKSGTIGFPLGGSQPYFPIDDEAPAPRFLGVLEINLLTQDLVVVCPPEYGAQLLNSAARHHGVAHFLFHPNHILKPGVADALCKLIDHGRQQDLEWWTGRQIYEWEILRRGVRATFESGESFSLNAPRTVEQAALLVLSSGPHARSISVDGRPMNVSRCRAHGFEFDVLALDITGDVRVSCA